MPAGLETALQRDPTQLLLHQWCLHRLSIASHFEALHNLWSMKWELQRLHQKPLKDLQKSFHTVRLTLVPTRLTEAKNDGVGTRSCLRCTKIVKAFISFPNSQECVFDGEHEALFTSGRITHVQTSNLAWLNKQWNCFPS